MPLVFCNCHDNTFILKINISVKTELTDRKVNSKVGVADRTEVAKVSRRAELLWSAKRVWSSGSDRHGLNSRVLS